ncbi:MAG: hypothetical protein ABSG52_14435 [Terriglobales bacterium]
MKGNSYTARDVAEFMVKELQREGTLYQDCAVDSIVRNFGEQFIYENENGNPAISVEVLAEFRKLTPRIVWEKGERCWRTREEYDEKGRAQS